MRVFQLVTHPSNIFNSFSDSAKVAKNSAILTVDMYDENGNRLAIRDTREPLEIVIGRPGTDQPPSEFQHAVMSSQDSRVDLFYYQVNVTTNDSSLHIEIAKLDANIQLLVLVRFNDFPHLNTTDQGTRGWDFMQLLPMSRTNISQSLTTCLLSALSMCVQCNLVEHQTSSNMQSKLTCRAHFYRAACNADAV